MAGAEGSAANVVMACPCVPIMCNNGHVSQCRTTRKAGRHRTLGKPPDRPPPAGLPGDERAAIRSPPRPRGGRSRPGHRRNCARARQQARAGAARRGWGVGDASGSTQGGNGRAVAADTQMWLGRAPAPRDRGRGLWRETGRRTQQMLRAVATTHHTPVLGIDAHGWAGASAWPFCSNSIEIRSGVRTKAMRPSRGGRLMTTPCACRCAQIA